MPTCCVADHRSDAMKHLSGPSTYVLSQFCHVLTGRTKIVWIFFHCDKHASEEKTILFWLAEAWVLTGKSVIFFENSIQQDAFFQIEARHFPLCKLQGTSHSTEVMHQSIPSANIPQTLFSHGQIPAPPPPPQREDFAKYTPRAKKFLVCVDSVVHLGLNSGTGSR